MLVDQHSKPSLWRRSPPVILFTLARWLLRELIGTLAATTAALARTLPLLLGVVTFFFFTAEVWQSVGRARSLSYALILLTFVGLGAIFLASRRQLDLQLLARFDLDHSVADVLADVDQPFDSSVRLEEYEGLCPLSSQQTFNLRLIAVLSRMVVAVVVAMAVGTVFTVLGALAIDAEVVKAWTLHDPTILVSLKVPGRTWILSWEHLRVVGFLSTFTGFYFSVVSATDPSLREGISDTADDAVRHACAVRLVYVQRRDAAAAANRVG